MSMPFIDPIGFINSAEVWRSTIIWLPSFLLWSIFWKGYALWRSARNYQKGWFIALLFINTLGVLEILYLALFQKDKLAKSKRQSK